MGRIRIRDIVILLLLPLLSVFVVELEGRALIEKGTNAGKVYQPQNVYGGVTFPGVGIGTTSSIGFSFPGTNYPGFLPPGSSFPRSSFPGSTPGTGFPGNGSPGTGFPGGSSPGTVFPGSGLPGGLRYPGGRVGGLRTTSLDRTSHDHQSGRV